MFKPAVYIHIPFCQTRCDYCDFYSTSHYALVDSFALEVIKQFKFYFKTLKLKPSIDSSPLYSLYLGGGTPASISLEALNKILGGVKEVAGSLPREVTLECNPRNVTPLGIESWAQMGVTRLSLGVQTFQDRFLKSSGRHSSRALILRAIDSCQKSSKLDLSLDLIQGLPGMTRLDQLQDLKEALSFKPDHLSWYSLILEESTKLTKEWDTRQTLSSRDLEEAERAWEEGCILLEEAGYGRYEVSNFAKNVSKESLHNKAYWKMLPFIGIGPSGVGMLPLDGEIVRYKNRADLKGFTLGQWSSGSSFFEEYETLDPVNFLKDYLLMGLRLKQGIHLPTFKKIFNIDLLEFFSKSLEPYFLKDFLIHQSSFVYLSSQGLNYLNPLLISLFEQIDQIDPISQAVKALWPL